jgi:DNA-binding CsgD family transcriptional regulator
MSLDPIVDLIGTIYEAVADPGHWSGALTKLSDFCAVENAALVVVDGRAQYSSVITPRANPAVVEAYMNDWWEFDPTAAGAATIAPGELITLDRLGRRDFTSSTFYNDFWKRSGLGAERLSANLFLRNGVFSNLVIQPSVSRDYISEEASEGFSHILPHMIRAVALASKLREFEMYGGVFDQPQIGSGYAGLLVVDEELRVRYADAGAEDLLASPFGISIFNGRLGLRDSRGELRLRSLVRNCVDPMSSAPGGIRMRLDTPDGEEALSIDVVPCGVDVFRTVSGFPSQTGALAVVRFRRVLAGRKARIEALQSSFGLTKAEAALTVEMLKGDGREAAGQRCGISLNTVRTHLTRVFDKVQVNRQAELVRVISDFLNSPYDGLH